MSSVADLVRTQQDTNRLLKLLIRATLTATQNPLVRKPFTRVVRDTDFTSAQLVIQPQQSLTVLDLPEKPDTDVDIAFLSASSTINSQKVRHILTAEGGKNRPFNFNVTQQEAGAAGFTSPTIFPAWTPLAAGVAGTFTLVVGIPFPGYALHRHVTLVLKNEDNAAATISSNGFFLAVYEYPQSIKDIFDEVLGDTDPESRTSSSHKRLEDIPA